MRRRRKDTQLLRKLQTKSYSTNTTSFLAPDTILSEALEVQKGWLNEIEKNVGRDGDTEALTWSAYHARKEDSNLTRLPSISCMLPLIDALSTTAGTMKHAMDASTSSSSIGITAYLNPNHETCHGC
ncbi:hypothetical protein ElyMa_003960300 [Elysia marginata]|uniref:Uncharacterized protein n=1 Tax=Elysia marginata TaxID=1093978 RepID=A0AAV4FUF6_9GAST|nr:hypothetical protein ElyMa_003960300 [Elysia marginata]